MCCFTSATRVERWLPRSRVMVFNDPPIELVSPACYGCAIVLDDQMHAAAPPDLSAYPQAARPEPTKRLARGSFLGHRKKRVEVHHDESYSTFSTSRRSTSYGVGMASR